MAAEGTDHCSEILLSLKVMNDSEINSKSDVICLDPGRRVIASAWSPKTGFHILDKSEYYKITRTANAVNLCVGGGRMSTKTSLVPRISEEAVA